MNEKDYTSSYRDKRKCFECAHNFFNNGEGKNDGCRAFPDGIPDRANGGYNHDRVLPGQVGNYVYRKVTYEELCPFAKYLYNMKHRKK